MRTQKEAPRRTQQQQQQQPPLSSATSKEGTESGRQRLDAPGASRNTAPLAAQHVDPELLAELLGSLEEPVVVDGEGYTGTANELAGLGGTITTQAVLDSLRSLDEFERQAAVHTEGTEDTESDHSSQHRYHGHGGLMAELENEHLSDSLFRAVAAAGGSSSSAQEMSLASHTPSSAHVGLGSFNEAELSAALEQIYWGSLDMPMATTPVETSTAFPTPPEAASAPVAQPATTSSASEYTMAADESDDDEGDDDNPLELEELSLFSLFLTDMAAFEGFLDSLSLNQLRQCAATVNSVLVRRESGMQKQKAKQAVSDTKRHCRAGKSVDVAPEPGTEEQSSGGDPEAAALSQPIMALLREWLPPSTADCVITALQSAELAHSEPEGPSATAMDDDAEAAKIKETGVTNSSKEIVATKAIRNAVDDGGREDDDNERKVETDSEGTPWLEFAYVQKGRPQRYRIRIDIDRAPASAIPASFKQNNCVYPRANCAHANYRGARWNYETECNGLGWKLAFLNQEVLSECRGLLQTAVNNYRTMVAGRKSRRITRMEKAERTQASGSSARKRLAPAADPTSGAEGASDKRPKTDTAQSAAPLPPPPSPLPLHASQSAKCLTLSAYVNGKTSRIRINVDLGSIEDDSAIDEIFRRSHAVFPRALDAPRTRYGRLLQGRWEFEQTCNELAWRLAWLNRHRLQNRKLLVQRCIDAYRARFSAPPWPLLSCHEELMGGSVDPRFFDYWRPRPGKRSLSLANSSSSSSAAAATTIPASSLVGSVSSSSSPEDGSAARVRAIRPRSSMPVPNASTPDLLQMKQPALQSQPMPQPLRLPTAAAPKPMRPRPVVVCQQLRPPPTQTRLVQARSVPSAPPQLRPPHLPLRSLGAPPRPPPPPSAAAAAAAASPFVKREAPNSTPATGISSKPKASGPVAAVRGGIRPVRSSPVSGSMSQRPTPATAAPLPRPVRPAVSIRPSPTPPPRPTIAVASKSEGRRLPHPLAPGPPVQRTVSVAENGSKASEKSAKAQAAANVLTDVLRQLSKSDPSLETLTGLLEKKNALSASKSSGAMDPHPRADDVPLDAKVAELEKMIIDLQND